jgi:hypothetical protein
MTTVLKPFSMQYDDGKSIKNFLAILHKAGKVTGMSL